MRYQTATFIFGFCFALHISLVCGCARKFQPSSNEADLEEQRDEKQICFEKVGCFSMEPPWNSPLRPFPPPYSPEMMETNIKFYTRENLKKEKYITLYPTIEMKGAKFDSNKQSVIIVHGYLGFDIVPWMENMKNAYLKHVDANVMIVSWGIDAQDLPYAQSASNTRMVGRQLTLFLKFLMDNYIADPGKFHLIGHSFGAHIVSYLAKNIPGIARLTALDPAQLGFEGLEKDVRLDISDANFVDVIHTNALPSLTSLGTSMILPVGHVDFYINGGFDQPGCFVPSEDKLPKINNILDLVNYPASYIFEVGKCPTDRAYEYLIEAFNEPKNCIFWGHRATVTNVIRSVTNTLTQGLLTKVVALSSSCSKDDCVPLGFDTDKTPLRGSFVVTTAGKSPFCISEPGIPAEVPPEKTDSLFEEISKLIKSIF